MYCDLRSAISGDAINKKPFAVLKALPSASDTGLGSRLPWSPISTTTVVTALRADRGLWGTWRSRGIAPAELPASWFRPASGAPRYYRTSTILAWLAARRGEAFDATEATRSWLLANFDALAVRLEWTDPEHQAECRERIAETSEWTIRYLVTEWARVDGPLAFRKDGIRFTDAGWRAYLDLLQYS